MTYNENYNMGPGIHNISNSSLVSCSLANCFKMTYSSCQICAPQNRTDHVPKPITYFTEKTSLCLLDRRRQFFLHNFRKVVSNELKFLLLRIEQKYESHESAFLEKFIWPKR